MSWLQHPVFFACRALLLILLAQSALGSIDSVFNIKQGGVGVGGCSAHKGKLNKWWTNARKLVDAALLYTQDDSVDGVEYVYTFFALDPPPADAEYRATARKMDWDDVAYDKETGEKFPNEDAKKVRTVVDEPSPGPDEADQPEELPFWSSGLREYFVDEAGDYCSKKFEGSPQNFAATHEGQTWATVTICVQNMKVLYPNEYLRLSKIQKAGKSIVDYRAQSLTLFHELFHVVLGNANTEEHDKSCKSDNEQIKNPNQDIISTEEALSNPESYTQYALCCVLGRRNEHLTFASTRSELKKKEGPKEEHNGRSEAPGHRKRLMAA
ncbi:uncharacterized protein BKA55DRAFT_530032 [Fusarium redolens]|uniref:Lysine-specific metallo-endopeptidase domain-containing protein n=1 Tax=Fusarium redolens TaxID=48865 RepID=A0A9P9JKE7_FUSRE|nr:uncharacterized protein BKA55DRAFT_530032 [Fusarium redolens]KAH7207826.1 hypothetical protein BKA55DRAFT_530032 [Fusarium redolens]